MITTLILVAAITVISTTLENPGVKMRVTNNGVNYVNRIAELALVKLLNEIRLDNMQGEDGTFSYRLSNVHTRGAVIPYSQISLNPAQHGLTWSISDFALDVHLDYWAQYQLLFIPISNSGSVTARFRQVSLTVIAGIDQNEDSSPKLTSRSCSAHIGDVTTTFHGNLAWLLNLLEGLFRGSIRNELNKHICPMVERAINVQAANTVKQMRLEAEIFNKFILDYHLTSPLLITANYLESRHKGAVYWKASRNDIIPFSPDPIPDWADYSNMINIWMTEYPLKSMLHFAHIYHFLQYTISTNTVPEQHKSYLQTTCPNSVCAGTVVPQLEQNYPNSLVTIQIKSSQAPDVNLTTNGLGLNLKAGLELSVDRPNGTKESVVLANVTISLVGSVNARDDRIYGHISQFVTRIETFQSNVGDIDREAINTALDEGMNLIIIPEINEVAKAGFPLPVIPDVVLRNSRIIYDNKYLIVATDVQYQGINK